MARDIGTSDIAARVVLSQREGCRVGQGLHTVIASSSVGQHVCHSTEFCNHFLKCEFYRVSILVVFGTCELESTTREVCDCTGRKPRAPTQGAKWKFCRSLLPKRNSTDGKFYLRRSNSER